MGIYVRDYRRSKKASTPGSMDDDSVKRASENKKKKEKSLQDIFDDNKTGRYSSDED